MRNNIIFFLIGVTLTVWCQAGTPPVGGVAIEKIQVPVVERLSDSQLYLMTEVLQDKIPRYDTSKYDTAKVSQDYVKVQKYVKDDINGALQFCLVHKGDKSCDLYQRIKSKLDAVSL